MLLQDKEVKKGKATHRTLQLKINEKERAHKDI